MKKTPVIFTGHGSPMLAIDENDLTREMQRVGADVLTSEDRPKAILAISAHWYVPGTYIQSAASRVKSTTCTASQKSSISSNTQPRAVRN